MIINGLVDGANRQARVDKFQVGPDEFEVMILSPRAGGVGLTLTRANHVIHLSRWWNPAVEDPCTGRVVRIGQIRDVDVHIPIAVLPNGDDARKGPDDDQLRSLRGGTDRLIELYCPPNTPECKYF
jgi:Helicase conserved C-terminal domain